jgi:hypothetical protein
MILFQLTVLEAKIARARQLLAEERRRVMLDRRVGEVAKSREILHDLGYWLHNLEATRERLLRLNQLDRTTSAGIPSARTKGKNAA